MKWIARNRFASSGLFHALLRSSCAWLTAHEKALPRSRQGDHQVPRTGLAEDGRTRFGRKVDRPKPLRGIPMLPQRSPALAQLCVAKAGTLRNEGPRLDWPKTAGSGLAVKWIARSRFASSGLFHALLRSSCAWLAAHEKALPRSRQGDHQVPRTGLEPAQPFGHYPLKVACLPISPPGQGAANIAACHIRKSLLFHEAGSIVLVACGHLHHVHAGCQSAHVQ